MDRRSGKATRTGSHGVDDGGGRIQKSQDLPIIAAERNAPLGNRKADAASVHRGSVV